MKKLLSIMLAVVMLAGALSVSVSASVNYNLMHEVYSNNTDYCQVIDNGDGSYTANVAQGWNSGTDVAYGMGIDSFMTHIDLTGLYLHCGIESDVPFRITTLDDGSAVGQKWIGLANEFYNVIGPVGEGPIDYLPEGSFFPAGKYEICVNYGSIYQWQTSQGTAGWDVTDGGIRSVYIEAKDPGSFTVNTLKLSDDTTYSGTPQTPDTPDTPPADDVARTKVSLLPADISEYELMEGGNGNVVVSKNGDAHVFTADGGWPSAIYNNPVTNNWVEVDATTDSYFNYDIDVQSGSAKVVVYFCGQSPFDQPTAGSLITINGLENPDWVDPNTGDTVNDLPSGQYKKSIKIADLGCREDLMVDGKFTISGIKVFAVGGVVVVNDLSVSLTEEGTTDTPTEPSDTPTDPTVKPTDPATDPTKPSDTPSDENIVVTLSTDKPTYTASEPITLTVNVANNGDAAVYDVNVAAHLPEGYVLADGAISNTIATLEAGQTVSLKAVYQKSAEGTTTTADATVTTTTTVANNTTTTTVPDGSKSPQTSDSSNAFAVVMIALGGAAVAVAMAYKNRKVRQMMSLVMVCTLTLSCVAMVPVMDTDAAAVATIDKSIDVTVDGATLTLTATVTYKTEAGEVEDKVLDGAKLVVFGDSLTAYGTWPLMVAEETNMYLFNGAMGGINTTEALGRFEKYVANQQPDFVTFCFGQNDLLMEGKNNPQVTPEQFKANLKKMCEDTVALGATPILMTCSYMNENIWWGSQAQNRNHYTDVGTPIEWLDQYCNAVRELAAENGWGLVDIRKACDEHDVNKFLTDDGVHLAELGNQVYAEKLSAYLKANYTSDPNAEKITNRYPHVDTPAEPAVTDFVSYDSKYWDFDTAVMGMANGDNGELKIYNKNGMWPEAHYAAVESVYAPLEGTELVFDFTTEPGINTSILLFFNGATPSAPSVNKHIVINKYLGCNTNEVDDIVGGQTVKGSVKLTDLDLPSDAVDAKGNVLISGVKVFAAGQANKNVVIRQLALSTTGAPNA